MSNFDQSQLQDPTVIFEKGFATINFNSRSLGSMLPFSDEIFIFCFNIPEKLYNSVVEKKRQSELFSLLREDDLDKANDFLTAFSQSLSTTQPPQEH